MTHEYESLYELLNACRVLDSHGIGWAAASAIRDNPFGDPYTVYTLYAPPKVDA